MLIVEKWCFGPQLIVAMFELMHVSISQSVSLIPQGSTFNHLSANY